MKKDCLLVLIGLVLIACNEGQRAQKLSSDGSTAQFVFLTRDHNENPVVAWTEKNEDQFNLFFATSEDDGKSFSDRISIPLSPAVATHAEGMPKVAFRKDGSIIAAYEMKTPTTENKYAGAIYYVMSGDGGKRWTEETFVHSDTLSGRSRSYFDIERLPDGEVGASWLDIELDNETGGRSVRFARTSKGKGFENEILVDSSACQCCRIDVYTDESQNIFVAYRGLKKGKMGKQIRDMMIATSTDHGKTFSAPLLISADNWNIDGCPHTGPSLCSNKAGLISLWYPEGSGTGIYYARKSNGDDAFSPRERITDDGKHPQLCANGDRTAMLWEEHVNVDGKAHTVIHYRIVKNGIDSRNDILTPQGVNAFLPVVTKTKDGFLVAYLMESNNDVGVYLQLL